MTKITKRASLLIFIFFIVIISFINIIKTSTSIKNSIDVVRPEEGVLDLRNWDFNNDGMIKLDGEWEYYHNNFLSTHNLIEETPLNLSNRVYSTIPGSYSNFGYGTYRLKVLTNKDPDILSVRIPFIQSAYSLWVDNKKIVSVGTVGKTKKQTIPQLLPTSAVFAIPKNEFYITLNVSNFDAKYGAVDTIFLGTESQIKKAVNKQLSFDMFLFGCTVIALIYNIALYFKRRKDKTPLYFATICFIISIRTLFLGERFAIYLFPNFSYYLSGKIMHLTFYLYIPFVILYIDSFYKDILSKKLVKLSNYYGILYTFIIIISPWKYYMDLVLFSEIIAIILLTYLLYKVSMIYVTGYNENKIMNIDKDYVMVIGILSLLVTRVNDILYEFSIIITGSFAPLGILVFVFINCYLISEKHAMAFANLEEINDTIQKTKPDESLNDTEINLNKRNEKNVQYVKKIIEYDKLKTEFFTNISHELRTPLNIIHSSIQLIKSLDKNKTLNDEKINYYLNIMGDNSVRLLRLINNLIDTTKLDSGYLDFHLKNENIVYIVEDLTQSVAEYIKFKDINLVFDTGSEEIITAIDEEKIERIVLNILSNSVKFTNEGGSIFVNIYDKITFVEIRIKDTGIGIPEDKLEYIFERFAQVNKTTIRNNEGSGIGLSLVKSLVEMHNGTIKAISKLGEGTEIIISLPIILVGDCTVNQNKDILKNEKDSRKALQFEFSDIYIEKND